MGSIDKDYTTIQPNTRTSWAQIVKTGNTTVQHMTGSNVQHTKVNVTQPMPEISNLSSDITILNQKIQSMEKLQHSLIQKLNDQNQRMESYIESNNAQFSQVMGTVEKLLSIVVLSITHDKNDPAILQQLTEFANNSSDTQSPIITPKSPSQELKTKNPGYSVSQEEITELTQTNMDWSDDDDSTGTSKRKSIDLQRTPQKTFKSTNALLTQDDTCIKTLYPTQDTSPTASLPLEEANPKC